MLEEALASARAAPAEVWDVRRRFQSVADVLVTVGAIAPPRAQAIVRELDDVLAVRALLPPSAFRGTGPGAATLDETGGAATGPRRGARPGDGWLETEIEHHLDLVVDLRPDRHPDVASQVLANLRPQVRALQAVGAVRSPRRVHDLAATFDAAGYAADHDRGEVDRGWLSFLRARPEPLTGEHVPVAERALDVVLGEVAGQTVRLHRIAWSTDVLELHVDAPATGGGAWRASAFDDSGQLHLGQPGQRRDEGGSHVSFRLRPGLRDGARSLAVRVGFGATRLDERASLS